MSDDPPRARQPSEVDFGEIPELARTLRALGSGRKSGGWMQLNFFSPLLEARRQAALSTDGTDAVRRFDAAALSRALERAIERIVQSWPDERMSARRALRAELRERTRDYAHSLDALEERAADVLAAAGSDRVVTWRAWTTQLAIVFDAADRAWIAVRSIVDALPPRS